WIDPQPVHVCRFTPTKPNAGGISVAAETFVPVTTPFDICCGLKALPSRNSSASNFPGPQLLRTALTVSTLTPGGGNPLLRRSATGCRLGDNATIAPTF